MISRVLRFAAAVCTVAVVGSACTTGTSVEVRPAAPDATTGGSIVVGIGRPGSIDPGNAYEPNGQLVVRTLCDPIMTTDPATGEFIGGLAESWLITDLGNKFTIRLRDDLVFNNGDSVTADDVVRGMSRIASEDYASRVKSLLALIDGFDEISGADTDPDDDDRDRLRGARVIDSRSFELRLRRVNGAEIRFPDILRVLMHPALSPIASSVVLDDPDAMASAPVCVGPYRLAEPWNGGDTIVLERHDNYTPVNGALTGGGAAYLDKITFRIFDDPNDALAAFEAGTVDLISVGDAQLDVARARFGRQVVSGLNGAVEYVGLPAGDASSYGSSEVRRAFSRAIDRSRIVRVLGGVGEPATSIIPPSVGPTYHQPAACGDDLPERPDITGARAILDEAGINLRASGTLTFTYNDEGRNGHIAWSIAQDWERAFGIEVELDPVQWQDYLAAGTGQEGFEGAFRFSWRPDFFGAEQYINSLFTSSGVGQNNFSRFADPELEDLLSRFVRRNDDADDIATEYRLLETEVLCDRMPMIPVAWGASSWAIDTSRFESASASYLDAATGVVLLRELHTVA